VKPDTGMKITQLVLKYCIVQKLNQPELDNYDSKYRKNQQSIHASITKQKMLSILTFKMENKRMDIITI
jgi:hypothetical protein